MHKTIYIEKDEEITSVLDRIEREPIDEIFLVIPKNAMISQGIINLKLLKNEVEKMAKKLIIVANDPHTKKVVSELGIATSDRAKIDSYIQQQAISQRASEEAVRKLKEEDQFDFKDSKRAEEKNAKEREIGSASFFDQEISSDIGPSYQFEIKKPPQLKKELFGQRERKREESGLGWRNNEMATSKNFSGQSLKKSGSDLNQFQKNSSFLDPRKNDLAKERFSYSSFGNNQSGFSSSTNPSSASKRSFFSVDSKSAFGFSNNSRFKPLAVKNENRKQETISGGRDDVDEKIRISNGFNFSADPINKKAEEFFSGNQKKVSGELINDEQNKKQNYFEFSNISQKKEKKTGIKGLVFITMAFVIVIMAGALTFWIFDSFPKVKVEIYPKIKEFKKEIRTTVIDGIEEIDFENGIVPGKYQEIEINKTIQATSSGEEFAQGGTKAEGRVKIINKYSKEKQSLVATTRILSREGKLFRLKESVVVPGMKDDQPGEIEVDVIADKAGKDFNIGPSIFTIEGFKESPKYEKFEVVSEKAMFGGADSEDGKKIKFVTEADIDRARKKAIEELETSFEEEIQKRLEEGDKTIIESVEKSIVSSEASNKVGDKVDGFSYTIVQKVKLISFSENDIIQLAETIAEKELELGYFLDQDFVLNFRKGIPDFEKKEMAMDIEIKAKAIPSIDENKVKSGIAGKSEEEIKNFLASFEEIKKAEVSFEPIWLKRISISQEKITVNIKKQ